MPRVKLKEYNRNKAANQVAEYFGVTVLTIQNWRKKGCPFKTIPMPGENSTRIAVLYSIPEVKKWRRENIRERRVSNGKY